jgi:sortase A
VTCTPYGINTHRLLVRGERVSTDTEEVLPVESSGPESAAALPGELILAGSTIFLLLAAGVLLLLRNDKGGCNA